MKFISLKWTVLIVITFIVWSQIASIFLYFFITKKFAITSPILFWYSLFFLQFSSYYLVLISSGFAFFIIFILFFLFLSNKTNIPDIYGKAKFATYFDIKGAKLFLEKTEKAEEGVYIGHAYSKMLRSQGFEHVTIFAPTGSGKTSNITIPNLLSWDESCVVSDIKLELFRLTSGYRASLGHKVYLLALGDPAGITHCYNPLDIISNNKATRIDDIQKLANIFIPDSPETEANIWEPQARMLFLALTLYVLDTENLPKTIHSVIKIFKSQPDFIETIREILATPQNLDPVCIENLMKLSELSERTRSSVTFTFTARFELFDNPLIVAATSRSDFDIRNLRKEKMTIYIGITNDNLVRLAPLISIFYQQVADVMLRNIPKKEEPYGVLLLMDEFSSLRHMESFHKNIGLFREFKLRIVILIQEISQLYQIYGRDGAKVFINAKIRIAYTQNDEETCQLIESLMGKKTIIVKNRSRNIKLGLAFEDRNESIHYAERPLMLAQEIRILPKNRAIILAEGCHAIYAKKIPWFKQKIFKERILDPYHISSILPEVDEMIDSHKTFLLANLLEDKKNNFNNDEEN